MSYCKWSLGGGTTLGRAKEALLSSGTRITPGNFFCGNAIMKEMTTGKLEQLV